MSLIIINHESLHLPKTPINRDPPQSYGRDSETFKRLEALPKSSSKPANNFNLQISRTFEAK